MNIPEYYDYNVPAGFLLDQASAQNALANLNSSYNSIVSGTDAQKRGWGMPAVGRSALASVPQANPYGFGGESAIRLEEGPTNLSDTDIHYIRRDSLPGGYGYPDTPWNAWAGASNPNTNYFQGAYFSGGLPASELYAVPSNWNTYLNNWNQVAKQAAGFNRLTPGYGQVQSNLDNQGYWDAVAQAAYDAASGAVTPQRNEALNEVRTLLGSRGQLGSSAHQNFIRRVEGVDTEGEVGGHVGNALSYYQGLRDTDFAGFQGDLNADRSTALAYGLPSRTASTYATNAASAESGNYSAALSNAEDVSLAGLFDSILKRLRATPTVDPTIGPGGGLPAYAGALASPSQVEQRLPGDQEFQGTFMTGFERPYKGKT